MSRLDPAPSVRALRPCLPLLSFPPLTRSWVAVLGAVLCLWGPPAATPCHASVAPRLTLDEMTGLAQVIVVGQLVEKESRWDAQHRWILTDHTFSIEQALRNDTPARFDAGATATISLWGGTVGTVTHLMTGAPSLQVGEHYLLLLAVASTGTAAVVGLDQGAFRIVRSGASGRAVVETVRDRRVRLDPEGRLRELSAEEGGETTLADFLAAIRARLDRPLSHRLEAGEARASFVDAAGRERPWPSLRPDRSRDDAPVPAVTRPAPPPAPVAGDAVAATFDLPPFEAPLPRTGTQGQAQPAYVIYGHANLPIVINQFPETPEWAPWSPLDQYQMSYWNRYADVFRVREEPTGTYGWNNGRWDLCGWLTAEEYEEEYGAPWGGATALTSVKMDGDVIEEADIAFSAALPWSVNPDDAFNGLAQAYQHILLHELGHTLGVQHNFTGLAATNYGSLQWQSHGLLYMDDAEAARTIYPGAAVLGVTDAGAYLHHYSVGGHAIVESTAPSPIVKGTALMVQNIHAENVGTVPVTRTLELYLTPARNWTGAHWLGTTTTATLYRGQFQLLTPSFTVPYSVPTGEYYVGLRIQGSGDYEPANDQSWNWERVQITAAAPGVQTLAADPVGASSATLNGAVHPRGELTYARFLYGTSPGALDHSTAWERVGAGTSQLAISAPIGWLQPATTYYFRLVADNPGGSADGTTLSLQTLPVRTLTVTTSGAAGFPASVPITVTPLDRNAQGDGTTPFTRSYDGGTAVRLTAPASASGWYFREWRKGGAIFSNHAVADVVMTSDATLSAVYVQVACPLPAPDPDTPRGASGPRPEFSWNLVTGADAYVALYVPVNDPSSWQLAGISTTNACRPDADIPDGDYAWVVAGWNPTCGFGTFSAPTTFTIPGTCPVAPTLLTPAPGAQVRSTTTLKWTAVPGASFYAAYVVDAATWRVAAQNVVSGPSTTVTLPAGTYLWIAVGFNTTCGWGPWSSPGWFIVGGTP